MLIDGAVGLVWAPNGQLARVLQFTITGGKIENVDILAPPEWPGRPDLAVLQK